MGTERIKSLHAAIRHALKPELLDRGFDYEASSRTFRKGVGECTQIVNVQVGISSLEGQFTVNLGVFHPLYRNGAGRLPIPEKPMEFDCSERMRLGLLRVTLLSKLFASRDGKDAGFLHQWLATPSDKWWPFTPSESENIRQISSFKDLLLTRGIGWLESKSDVEALRVAYEAVHRARNGA